MQDRFRFRAWTGRIMLEDITLCNGSYVTCSWEYCEDYIVMQCTGLKDKDGKLIYEGDILGGTYGNLDIFYCPQCMQFELHCKGYGCMSCNGDVHWCEVVEDNNRLEVVGNIYENPELMEDNNG